MTKVRMMMALAGASITLGLWFAFTSPTDALQGEFTRIINVHVPSLWVAFLAFGVTALGSIAWLVRRTPRWDRIAASSVEVGVLFTAIGLATGMVWGQAVWGQAWDWGDWRLTTTAVMFFVYLGYLALRSATPDPEVRARRSAVLGILAVIQVPLVYFSVNLFRTLHQTQSIRPDGSTMPQEMLIAMLVNVFAFTVLYLGLMAARLDVAKAEDSKLAEDVLAGDAVKPPSLSDITNV